MRKVIYQFKNGATTTNYNEAEAARAKFGSYKVVLEDIIEVPAHIQKKRKELGLE